MNARPPVLIALERWNPAGGGRERYAAELAAWLLRRSVPVSVACAAGAGAAVHACGTVDGLHAFVARWRERHPDGAALAMIPIAAASHVQLHSGLTSLARAAQRRALGRGVRGTVARIGGAFSADRRKYEREESAVLAAGGPALMAFSSRDAEEAVRDHGVARARMLVAHPGIDRAKFPAGPAARTPGALRAVFAGHNPRLKGLAAAIAAVSAANRSGADVRLTAAGRQSRAATATHRLTRRARAFLRAAGDLAQPDLVALFHESDVLLHPAHYDPFPRVVLEGMACGCVPIVSRACGVADVLTDGVDAFLVDSPADVDGMAAALTAARDAARMAVMRRAAIARAAAFDFDAHAATVLTWLQ